MKKLLFFLTSILAVTVSAQAADVIRIDRVYIHPDTEENRQYIRNIMLDASFYIEKIYKGKISLSGVDGIAADREGRDSADSGGPTPDCTLQIHATREPDSKVISFNMTRNEDGKEGEAVPYMGEWVDGLGADIGRLLFYQWASIYDFELFEKTDPAGFVDEFAMDLIPRAAIPVQNIQIYPYSLAMKSDGNILVGANSIALEMDRNFRILDFPGRELVEKGNYTYAFGIDVTPGGTIYFKPSTGGDLYSLIPGTTRPRRMRTGISGPASFTVLPDSSAVLVDATQKRAFLLRDRNRIELDIFPFEYSYITEIYSGPGGNIWVKDSMDKHIRIYSPEGKLVDAILPLADTQDLSGVRGIAVYRNGDFVLLSQTALMKFKHNGEPLWRLDELPSPDGGSFNMIMDVAVDSDTGLIYLTDYSGRRLFKLLDVAYAQKMDADVDFELTMMKSNETLMHDPYDAVALAEKAVLYEEAGAVEAAITYWQRVLESDPFHREAEERLSKLELKLLENKADELRERALETLHTLGPESARQYYSEAVKVYEQILFRNPSDGESKRELQALKEEFQLFEGPQQKRGKPLQVVTAKIKRLFPSLLKYYRNHPAGSVVVKNPFDQEARDVRAEVFIKNFMDFPAETDKAVSIPPGKSMELDLPVQFNRTIFTLEEDLPVQVQITLTYQLAGESHSVTTYKTSTLYRRTALSWDDSRKLAAFIMPNEEVVSQFSHRVASAQAGQGDFRLSSGFLRAAAICDAVGSYGIEYIEDPSSPITPVLENADVVDTVRFPRTTLYYQSGDCDDSTALLCSLLESAGVPTAIMTSPGHVFFAFDTGEPSSNAWQYSSEACETVIHDRTVWIPVEATILKEGFFTAWEEASKLVARYSALGELEFLPVREAWGTYPALPLPESAFTIAEPAPERVGRALDATFGAVKDSLYKKVVAALTANLERAGGRSRARLMNKLGILHARFGEDDEAEEVFREALDTAPSSVSAYVNLANLKLLQNKPKEALSLLEQGKRLRPESVVINLLLAKTYHQTGNSTKAKDHYRLVEKQSPEAAKSIAYIQGEGGGGSARASEAAKQEPFYWDVEE